MSTNRDYLKIKEDLEKLGIKKGDDLLIHSSFKSLGAVEGGIQTLIEALLATLGDSGTLLFPSLSFKSVNADNGFVFNISQTPCCVGAIPEFFRHFEGVERSMHPTHSVCALGKRQREYINDHILDNQPVGENSPFYKLREYGGKVMFLGCRINPNTSMHGVEEKSGVPYILSENMQTYTLLDKDGGRREKDYYFHKIWQNGYNQRYDRLENIIEFTRGAVHGAACAYVNAPEMWDKALMAIEKNPYYFVEERTDEEWLNK